MNTVCFDMDGVIVDSERHWVPLENERILPTIVPSGDIQAQDITGMNVNDLYQHLSERFDTKIPEPEFLELYEEAAEELYNERVELMDGFEELLRTLRGNDVNIALVSSSPPHWIQYVLDRFSLESGFDVIVSASDIEGQSKPAPDIYSYAVSELGDTPSQSIAVEDSEHGVAAANAAGMYSVGYRTEENENQNLADADEVIDSSDTLQQRLVSLTT